MRKYRPLQAHLEALPASSWSAPFAEIERILGFRLPESARRFQAWWANQEHGPRPHARAWLAAGWRTRGIDLRNGRVTFVRDQRPDARRTGISTPSRANPPTSATVAALTSHSDPAMGSDSIERPIVALVACAKTKASHPTKAKDLYVSQLFRKSRAYVERCGWRWYILSAQHGLVDPETVLEPYDRSLIDGGQEARRHWATGVMLALDPVLAEGTRVVVLAGNLYSHFLVPALAERGHLVEEPLKGLSLGPRLALLGELAKGPSISAELSATSGPQHASRPGRRGSPGDLSPVDREHYEVARHIEGFFDRAEFMARYRQLYPHRSIGSIIPSDYCFNQENKGNARDPRFLWWDGRNSYVFVGLNGAPKDFASIPTGAASELGRANPAPAGPRLSTPPVGVEADGLREDVVRARALAECLHKAILPWGDGIFGEHQMPEDILPSGLAASSREQLLFLTLTVSVDYMRPALELWRSAREAWANAETRYLFEPRAVIDAGYTRVEGDLKRRGVSRKTRRDALAWFTIARTLSEKWNGDPRAFLEDCNNHAPTILRRLNDDKHLDQGRMRSDFPLLKGPKIAPLWVRTLRDNAGIELSGLDEVPIPVDVHVLRATLCTGVMEGSFNGSTTEIFAEVRRVWRDATYGLRLPDGRPMAALDVDEALWTLSRLGCSKRGNGRLGPSPPGCPAAPGCVAGTILIQGGRCAVNT